MAGGIAIAGLSVSAPAADAASQSYASSSFGYGVYIGGGSGKTFTNVSDPYFTATHKGVKSGSASGVIYQIRYTGGNVYKYSQQAGAITNKKVSFSGDLGSKKAYLRNMYNESTPQSASGKFNW